MNAPKAPGVPLDPPYDYPSYRSTSLRAPKRALAPMPEGLTERRGPVFGRDRVEPGDSDLTRGNGGKPIGERIIVTGRVTDSSGRPVRDQLVEIWQANAAGRYRHGVDRHDAPLDPNFTGAGRCLTDGEGRYRFTTIRPGEYPWENHHNAWRPAHVHFSVFGTCFVERLVTQMYFPGDPLLAHDPLYQSIRDRRAAELLVAKLDPEATVERWALGYVFDIVLGGRRPTPPKH
ncbi:MAG TPA: protocatechuate 3,4-dioxygenase subunit beta [Acidimicrobiales bacterium]|nr:protocatechuate 3,4-dioxygenase subunit beta [Acidimicrobiales bacterium]